MKPSERTSERREYIKYQLRIRGSSLAEVSRELGVSVPTVSLVIKGIRKSARVMKAVAAKLGVPVEALQ